MNSRLFRQRIATWSILGLIAASVVTITRATIASVNAATGVVTNGDVVELAGYGSFSDRTRSLFSGDGPSGTTFYAMTGLDSYSTTTWELPD